jgi:hypothetical protein
MQFALNAEKKDEAIYCDSSVGPPFGALSSWLGGSSVNNTDLDERTVLTGSLRFIVKEIEVFEITD